MGLKHSLFAFTMVPRLARDHGHLLNNSDESLPTVKSVERKEDEAASEKLLKKRRFSMDVCSIQYEDDNTCTILLNLTFDLRAGQTLSWPFPSAHLVFD